MTNLERHLGSDHKEEEDSEGPDVHRGAVIGVIVEEFGGCIRRRSAERGQHEALLFCLAANLSGEAEIAEPYTVGRGEKDVFCFYVPMIQIVAVLQMKRICNEQLDSVNRELNPDKLDCRLLHK